MANTFKQPTQSELEREQRLLGIVSARNKAHAQYRADASTGAAEIDYTTAPDRVSLYDLSKLNQSAAPGIPKSDTPVLDFWKRQQAAKSTPEIDYTAAPDRLPLYDLRQKDKAAAQNTPKPDTPEPDHFQTQQAATTTQAVDYMALPTSVSRSEMNRSAPIELPTVTTNTQAEPLDRQSVTTAFPDSKLALANQTIGQTWHAAPFVIADTAKQAAANMKETVSDAEYQKALAQRNDIAQQLDFYQPDSRQYKNLSSRLDDLNKQLDALTVNTPVSADAKSMQLMQQAGQTRQQYLEGMSPFEQFFGGAALSIGQNAVMLPLAAVNPALPLVGMGALSAADKMYQLNRQGVDARQSLARGAASGGIEAATEYLPLHSLMDLVTIGGSSVAAGLLKQVGVEAGEEGVSYFANYLADSAARDPDAKFDWGDFWQQVGQGGLSGLFFGGVGTALGAHAETGATQAWETASEATGTTAEQSAPAAAGTAADQPGIAAAEGDVPSTQNGGDTASGAREAVLLPLMKEWNELSARNMKKILEDLAKDGGYSAARDGLKLYVDMHDNGTSSYTIFSDKQIKPLKTESFPSRAEAIKWGANTLAELTTRLTPEDIAAIDLRSRLAKSRNPGYDGSTGQGVDAGKASSPTRAAALKAEIQAILAYMSGDAADAPSPGGLLKKYNVPGTVTEEELESAKDLKRERNDTTEGAGESSKIPWDSWQNYEKVTANGQEYAKVGDRLYSRHAVDRMQPSGKRFTVGDAIVQAGGVSGRSVAPQFVENVISSVKPVFQPATGNYIYSSGTVKIVTNKYGHVVTIMTVG